MTWGCNVGGTLLNECMRSLTDTLESVERQLAAARAEASARGGVATMSASEQVEALRRVGELQRLLDALVVEVVDDIQTEDAARERSDRVTARAGCRNAGELLQRTMLVDRPAAHRYTAAASAMHEDVGIASGDPLPGAFPELTKALLAGEMSLAGFLACVGPLQRAQSRISADALSVADTVLARTATGRDVAEADSGQAPEERAPCPTVEELAALVAHVLLRIDPDGAAPDDDAGERTRSLSIGRLNRGTVPVRGNLLPEVAGALQRLLDAYNNPRVQFSPAAGEAHADADSDVPPEEAADPRTPTQKRQDAFAAIIMSVAAAGAAPQLGGAAPTLVVAVNAADFASGSGRAHIENTDWDVPMSVARHTGCAGGVQRVLFDEAGAIIGISTSGRIFTAHQRKAIMLRDGACLIPGCEVRADWCEVHHVQEWSRGGPTHTSNGVALCWHHHRTLERSGWQIRMKDGVPEIRGPAWWDPYCRWRAPRSGYRAVDRAIAEVRSG